jgi:hypothetical protein
MSWTQFCWPFIDVDRNYLAATNQVAHGRQEQSAPARCRPGLNNDLRPKFAYEFLVHPQIQGTLQGGVSKPRNEIRILILLPAPVVEIIESVDNLPFVFRQTF